jgi:hypothetical protein
LFSDSFDDFVSRGTNPKTKANASASQDDFGRFSLEAGMKNKSRPSGKFRCASAMTLLYTTSGRFRPLYRLFTGHLNHASGLFRALALFSNLVLIIVQRRPFDKKTGAIKNTLSSVGRESVFGTSPMRTVRRPDVSR